MIDRQQWDTPEFEALTEEGLRADRDDVAVRNGLLLGAPAGSSLP